MHDQAGHRAGLFHASNQELHVCNPKESQVDKLSVWWHRNVIRVARAVDRPLGRIISRAYDRLVDAEGRR